MTSSRLQHSLLVCTIASTLSALGQPALAQRDLKDIPKPDPVAERNAMQLGDGIEVQLFASDPMFAKPIHSNFDAKGRLWIASSSVYPQIAPGEKANDQVVVLEDTDRDGKADKSTVFAENLLIPTGVLPTIDGTGAYVAASTQLLFLQDTDGDGKSDYRRVELSGFGTEDTHHLLHTLRWGPDGWLYMNQSIYIHSHVETPYGTKHLDGGGIWRYHPATKRLEVVCKGFVNPWGHIFDGAGQHFATDGAYGEGINFVFPGSVFVTSPGAERWLNGLNPGSPKHCGLEILSGSHIPPDLYGQMITNDFRSHRVCRFQVSRNRDGYLSQQQQEVIRTEHVAFRPIDAKVGSDGALYISDWYNPIIQHGEVDFRDERRDRTHGRIWRVTWKNRPVHNYAYRSGLKTEELLSLLSDSLELTRQSARLDLATRPSEEVDKAFQQWIAKASNEPFHNTGLTDADNRMLEYLRWNESANRWDNALVERILQQKNPRLRAIAIQMGSWNLDRWTNVRSILDRAIVDEDWQVRLAAVVCLRKLGDEAALDCAMRCVTLPMHSSIDFALWSFVRESEGVWSTHLQGNSWAWTKSVPGMLFVAKASKSDGFRKWLIEQLPTMNVSAQERESLIDSLATAADAAQLQDLFQQVRSQFASSKINGSVAAGLMNRITDHSAKRNLRAAEADSAIPSWWKEIASQNDSAAKALQQSLVLAAGRWQVNSMVGDVVTWIDRESANATSDSEAGIANCIENLGSMKHSDVVKTLERWAAEKQWKPSMRAAAVMGIARQDLAKAAKVWAQVVSEQREPPYHAMGLVSLASRKGGPEALLKQLTHELAMAPESARTCIEALQGASIQRADLIDALKAAGKLNENKWVLSPEFVAKVTDLARTSGDPKRGEMLYRQASLQCSRCHPIGTAGGQIGPNLISLGGSSQVDYIIESLIDPQAKLKEGFQTIVVLTDEGQVISGLERSRTPEKLSLLTAEGNVVEIARDSISEEKTGKSLMPAGLVDGLSMSQLADLVRFLSELGRTPEYSISSSPVVRAWKYLKYSADANTVLNRTSLDSLVIDHKALEWQPIVTRIDGTLPLAEMPKYRPHREMIPFVAAKANLSCKKPGKMKLQIVGAAKWLLWIDGKPVDLQTIQNDLQWTEGEHTVHLVVDEESAKEFGLKLLAPNENAAVFDLGS